jgi:hypothetical protein
LKTTVHYFCFGIDDNTKDKLTYFPSSFPKIRYVSETIKKLGYKVNIVSSCSIKKKGIFLGRSFAIDDLEVHRYFTSFKTAIGLINKISILFTFAQLIHYCLFCVKKNEPILIYHSLYYLRPLKIVHKLKKCKFILEVEEIYSCFSNKTKRYYQSEIAFINTASAYLLVNDLIDEKINRKNKPAIISYGNYSIPNVISAQLCNRSHINIVYAGVIENIRKAAFIAVDSMRFLDDNYRLHILGFGNDKDIAALKERLNEINAVCGDVRVIFHGYKSGDTYYSFLQSCDIALSCHTYKRDMPESSDYQFPSKIITYLANGLRVVSSKIRCVEKSKIGNIIYFYDDDSAKEIAKTILSINISENYDSRKLVKELDDYFSQEMKKLLEWRINIYKTGFSTWPSY